MPQCHKCPHAADIAAGKYANTDYEKTPCAPCKWTEHASNKGKTLISLDAIDANDTEGTNYERGEMLAALNPKVMQSQPMEWDAKQEALAEVLRLLMALTHTRRNVVLWRLQHPHRSIKIIAAELDISIQAAHEHIKTARRKHPELAAILSLKAEGPRKKKTGAPKNA